MKARGDIFAGEIKFVKDVIRRACFMPHTLRPGCLSAHWGAHLETLARWWMHCTLANMEILIVFVLQSCKKVWHRRHFSVDICWALTPLGLCAA